MNLTKKDVARLSMALELAKDRNVVSKRIRVAQSKGNVSVLVGLYNLDLLLVHRIKNL